MSVKFVLTDDDADDRELFVEALNEVDSSITCVTSENADATIKLLKADPALPQLLFLDINLPRVSGWDLLTKLKKEKTLASIPVVMYSTSPHEHDRQKSLAMGALGMITKPSDFTHLKNLLAGITALIVAGKTGEIGDFVKKLHVM